MRLKISIHAPAKGATSADSIAFARTANFNPRSREGSDVATSAAAKRSRNFNPRSREGSDLANRLCGIGIAEFQSTLPRRERPQCNNNTGLHAYFNPRSREGSDYFLVQDCTNFKRFQSTLPRRERPASHTTWHSLFIFQSTLPRRERLYIVLVWIWHLMIFQSTLPRRERRNNLSDSRCHSDISIHAPAKGATRHRTPFSIF